jgi:primosomal protein N' (replication factor Y)
MPTSTAQTTETRIAKVEPLTTARALRGPFDYRLGPGWEEVETGTLLQIPFGHQRLLGVVTEIAASSDLAPERLAEPLAIAGDTTLPADLVELGLWLADEYCSTPARGLGLVLPPGTGSGGIKVKPRLETQAAITAAGKAALDGGERLSERQRQLLQLLAEEGELAAPQIRDRVNLDGSGLRRLEKRGLIALRQAVVRRRPVGSNLTAAVKPPRLNTEQHQAVERLSQALAATAGEPERLLLHGVTGSGKTEVYLAAVERALASGRGAIVLVPEIALTPQAVARFQARLGERIAVIHSALKPGERFDEWSRLRSGEAQVCVGPRSAVLAPVRDLGLVVIDEEHDSSYKQEQDPRYDAREVAERRLQGRGGALVAGTATPRPESWQAMGHIHLPNRVDGRGLPPVELVDMRNRDPRSGPLGERTLEGLERVRQRGEKAIVLINRRGFSPWLTCRSCGHHWGCPNCDVSLITHRESGLLICHHCDHREPLPRACSECGSTTLAREGAGTERVEAILRDFMSPFPIFRLDADTVAREGGHAAILERFASAKSGVLVGTQMVAKGHDFPEVTLAVVLDADATLRFPDFRAAERTFALVTQLAGRSGRGEAGGEVIVQTLAPEAPSIRYAEKHDAAGFLAGELERRRILRYPPFSHLVGIMLASPDETRLVRAAATLRERLAMGLPEDAELLGPALMFRARNRFRRRFLIKAGERRPAAGVVGEVVRTMASEGHFKHVAVTVDVSPQ